MKLKIKCTECNKDFERYECQIKNRKNVFCSMLCKTNYQKGKTLSNEIKLKISKSVSGKNNPNYGNTWNDEQRKHQSDIINEWYKDPLHRYKVGNSNRGKEFSKELIEKMHGHRTPESYSTPHTEKSKRLIGIKSSAKFTPEYKMRFRKIMEENGSWLPLNESDDYKLYYKFSNWNKRMFESIHDRSQLILLKERGIFNAKTNSKGVVRDHMYSRKTGFENKICPELLRHPANCRIVLHSENVRTSRTVNITDDILTVDELIENIKNYNMSWHEQKKCISLIEDNIIYNKGILWRRKIISVVRLSLLPIRSAFQSW